MVKIFRRFCLSLVVFVLFISAVYLIFSVYFSITDWLLLSRPLYDNQSSARAWLDINGNGVWDKSEQPLSGICIWSDTSPYSYDETQRCQFNDSQTDEKGKWLGDFFPGSKGDDIYIFADALQEYHSTTPPAVNSSYAEFGFAPKDIPAQQKILTRYEYVSDTIYNQELKFKIDKAIFWISVGFIAILSIISAIKFDIFLIRKGIE